MEIENLKMELSEIAPIEVIKAGEVFTLFMSGRNFTSYAIFGKIQDLVLKTVNKEYPHIEVFKNDENFLLMVLKR